MMTEIEAYRLSTKMQKAAYEAIAPFYETIFDNSLVQDDVQIWLPTKEDDKNRAEITFLPNKSPVYEEEKFKQIDEKMKDALRCKGFKGVMYRKEKIEEKDSYGRVRQYVKIWMIMAEPLLREKNK